MQKSTRQLRDFARGMTVLDVKIEPGLHGSYVTFMFTDGSEIELICRNGNELALDTVEWYATFADGSKVDQHTSRVHLQEDLLSV
jgi:hypothetical protein